MKNSLKAISFLVLFFAITGQSFAETQNWEILDFHSDITINQNGKVEITENILADFTNEAHRGIGRSILY